MGHVVHQMQNPKGGPVCRTRAAVWKEQPFSKESCWGGVRSYLDCNVIFITEKSWHYFDFLIPWSCLFGYMRSTSRMELSKESNEVMPAVG